MAFFCCMARVSSLAGKKITQNGLGLMRLTWVNNPVPDEQAFKVLKAALSAGATVWNAADFYGTPDNNSLHLMNRYFTAYPEDADRVVLAIKSGLASRSPFTLDGSASGIRKFTEDALTVLDGKKTIDIFGLARVDPDVPIEESLKALAELRDEGKIDGIHLTEVKAEMIRRAASVTKIDMVEAEVSLWARDVFHNGVAETCAELGIVLVAHSPLGAGMLTGGTMSLNDLGADNPTSHFPRFQPENFSRNVKLVEALEDFATAKGCTTAQLALSWVKAQSKRLGMPFVVPIAGARSEARVLENTIDPGLTEDELKSIDAILDSFPVAGERFPAAAARFNEY
ncbi:aldo/keto reductase family protein [Aspergillus clavatus NRRL 1]|uniref:Aldo/keto reductase n=1 Tax=Aspergillus clavatus (strain ATCC 1007 / CBS 513.65 / DSM 816 / NCTC 3887 / NRRL 1 / QM 1276 / 107) TaxID=344612 RepID=A1C598_ASPCL|nr:aldo/keto reductase [Aspergillus clavatus NRRL 1]EAW14866.1 aldo/keto reductase [Aspergillus clavatus NRRL 1]